MYRSAAIRPHRAVTAANGEAEFELLDAEGLAKYEALVQQDVERFRRECEERGFDPAELMRGMTTRDVPEKTALSWVRGGHFRG